jgi:hypothetical protein
MTLRSKRSWMLRCEPLRLPCGLASRTAQKKAVVRVLERTYNRLGKKRRGEVMTQQLPEEISPFWVGTVDIAIREGVECAPTAVTTSMTLGSADLGAEIKVEIPSFEWDEELGGDMEDLFDRDSVEIWLELLRRMRIALASFMIFCRMRPFIDGRFEGEQDEANIEEAIGLLEEDFFWVKPEMAVEAVRARSARENRVTEGLEVLKRLLEARENSTEEQ